MNANPLSMPNSDPLWNNGNSEENQPPLNHFSSIYDNMKQPNGADPYSFAIPAETGEGKRSAVDNLSHLASKIDQLTTSDSNTNWPSVSRSTISSPLVTGNAVPSLPLHSQQLPPQQSQQLHSHQVQWVYLDPSGNEQGPFDGNMMQSWFSAGYLQPNLKLKNSVDSVFRTLGEFMADCGEFELPFLVPLPLVNQHWNPLNAVNQRPQSPWVSHSNSVVDLSARKSAIDLSERNSPFVTNASLNAFTPEPEPEVHVPKTVDELAKEPLAEPLEEPLEEPVQKTVEKPIPHSVQQPLSVNEPPQQIEDQIKVLKPVERFAPTEEAPREVQPSKPKLAPWASKSSAKPKLSLKEIQEMEAAENSKRREQQESESREAAKIAAAKLVEEEKLEIEASKPKQFSKSAPWAAIKSAPMKPGKTLEDIQREEAAAAAKVANASAKTSFATAAATYPASHDTAWTVVSKKNIPRPKPQPTTAAPLISASKTISPAMLRSASTNTAVHQAPAPSTSSSNTSPSREFLAWCRQSLSQLNDGVNKEDVLSIMLQLPLGFESQEIIGDTIYSNSSTMDGRRFASDFMNRRAKVESLVSGAGIHFSWAEAQANSGDSTEYDDWNSAFKVVTKKGKRRN